MSPRFDMGSALLPKTIQSELIWYSKRVISSLRVVVRYTGETPLFYVSVNGDYNGPGDWEQVTLTGSGVPVTHTPTNTGGFLYYRAVISPGTVIFQPTDATTLKPTAPAISIGITEGAASA